MALSYLTGWEHNVLSQAGGGIVTTSDSPTGTIKGSLVTSPVKNGTYAYKAGAVDAGGDFWGISSQKVVVAGWFRTPASTKRSDFISVQVSGGNLVFIQAHSGDGNLHLHFYDGVTETTLVDSGVVMANDTWYWIELMIDSSANPWVIKWAFMKDGGARQVQTDGGVAKAAYTFTQVAVGPRCWTDAGGVAYSDDLHIYTGSTADYPVPPKAVELATVDQAAAAEHQSITLTNWDYTADFSSFTNFASTVETDSRSRLNALDTANGIRINKTSDVAGNARWKIAAPANPRTMVHAVCNLFSMREASAGTNNLTVRSLLSGSTTNHFSGNPGNGTTWNYLAGLMATTPAGGGWVASDIAALRAEVDSTDASPNLWIGGIVYEVSYEAAPWSGPPDTRRTRRSRVIYR